MTGGGSIRILVNAVAARQAERWRSPPQPLRYRSRADEVLPRLMWRLLATPDAPSPALHPPGAVDRRGRAVGDYTLKQSVVGQRVGAQRPRHHDVLISPLSFGHCLVCPRPHLLFQRNALYFDPATPARCHRSSG